jgi:hypothetical protein
MPKNNEKVTDAGAIKPAAPVEPLAPESTEVKVTSEVSAEVAEVAEVVAVRKLKVRALVNHTCRIAGEEISIVQDKVSSVNEDVAYILQRSGKAVITT